MQFADRLLPLQSNVFADMDIAKSRVKASGKQVIDLSLGSSDLPTDKFILEAIAEALSDTSTHGYSLFGSTFDFREAVARWITQRFGVTVDPETEVLPLIGSQEGTAHLPLALLNPNDLLFYKTPGIHPIMAGFTWQVAKFMECPYLLRIAFCQYLPIFRP